VFYLSGHLSFVSVSFEAYKQADFYMGIEFNNKYLLMYIQQDATLRSLFYLETALHVSGGISTHHQERKQLYLQHLVLVRPLHDAVDTVVYAPDDGWRYHPKHAEQFPDKINCVTLHLVGYILEYSYDARTHES
jgi:hypothetical protein